MKKKLLFSLCVLLTFSFVACSEIKQSSIQTDSIKDEVIQTFESKIVRNIVEDDLEAGGVIESDTSSKYEFIKDDDKNGTFKEYTIYKNDDNLEYITVFNGTYEIENDNLTFTYTGSEDNIVLITAKLNENTNELSDVEINYTSKELIDISGTYTGNDDVYGEMSIEVGLDGDTNVITSNGTYDGYLYKEDNVWILSFSDEDIYESWTIEFDGSSFTHVEQEAEGERTFVESRTISGPLGELTLDLYSDSYVETTVEINGVVCNVSGYLYDYEADDSTGNYYCVSLTSDDFVYDVYLEVENNAYTGHYSKNF